MFRRSMLVMLFVLLGNSAYADVKVLPTPTRGELLYSTHCIACHNVEMHWREKGAVTGLTSLQAQVRRWQEISGLGWDHDDIAQVVRYLNSLHYHYPGPD